jgi:hypothetical protein
MKRDSQPIPKPFQGQRQQSNRPTLKKRIYDQTFESTVYPQQTSRNRKSLGMVRKLRV